jgi:hypothetical protein
MDTLKLILKTVVIIVATVFGLRIFTILLQRFPGLFVSLSAIALGVLIVAMYKGSFAAVGLKNRRAIALAMTAAVIVFLVSGAILLFVDRP